MKRATIAALFAFLWASPPVASASSIKVITEDLSEEGIDGARRFTTIEEFLDETHHLTERLYWINTPAHHQWRLGAKAWEDEAGTIFMCLVFTYDDTGQLIEETLYGNLSGNSLVPLILDEHGIPLSPEVESFTRARDAHPSDESSTIVVIDPETGDICPPHIESPRSLWRSLTDALFSLGHTLQSIKQKLSYSDYMQEEWDRITHETFHKGFLQFSGYYRHPADTGCTPYGVEIDGKVRVTLINGILNIRDDMDQLLKLFSESHGNVPIHYVFRPTEGWSRDVISSTLSKMGFVSVYAFSLAETWRGLIEEMGGVGNGGRILHYAHSIGGTDTYVAKGLMTPEELAMIDVITMGSPSMIPNSFGFKSAINYISKRDGVCLLDPVGYVNGWIDANSNAEFLGSFLGFPLIDHTLYTETYGKLVYQLGDKFIENPLP